MICKFDLFQLYGEYFDKAMFEYVLNLIYNLPKSEASVVYSEMTDKPNEIRLGNAFLFSFFNMRNIIASYLKNNM